MIIGAAFLPDKYYIKIKKTNHFAGQDHPGTPLLSLPTMHRVAAWRRKNSWKGDAGKFCSWLIQTR